MGRAISGGVSRRSCGLKKSFQAASLLMDGTVIPPCQFFCLQCPSTGAYRLLSGARFWCQNVSLQGRAHPDECLPVALHQCPCPQSEPQLLPISSGDPPRTEGRAGPGSQEVLLLLLVPRFVCAFQEWSLSLTQSRGAPAFKHHWPSKPEAVGSPPPDARPPGWETCRSSEPSFLWENLCDIIVFQFVGYPPGGDGI